MAMRFCPPRGTDSAEGLCGDELRTPSCPAAIRPSPSQKKFCGADGVPAVHQQVVVGKFNMRGSKPQLEGQCHLAAITFVAGTVTVTPSEWRNLATNVSFEDPKPQVRRRGHHLAAHHFVPWARAKDIPIVGGSKIDSPQSATWACSGAHKGKRNPPAMRCSSGVTAPAFPTGCVIAPISVLQLPDCPARGSFG